MSVWVLVAAYLVIFVLLQVAVYRYVRGDDEGSTPAWGQLPNAEAGPRRDRPVDSERPGDRGSDVDRFEESPQDLDRFDETDAEQYAHANVEGSTRRCPNCGARNASERVFVFCRRCAGPLGR